MRFSRTQDQYPLQGENVFLSQEAESKNRGEEGVGWRGGEGVQLWGYRKAQGKNRRALGKNSWIRVQGRRSIQAQGISG